MVAAFCEPGGRLVNAAPRSGASLVRAFLEKSMWRDGVRVDDPFNEIRLCVSRMRGNQACRFGCFLATMCAHQRARVS